MQAEANLDHTVLDIVDARVGTVVRNKWHVDALLGTGGMAAVYAATHRNGNRVALKVLHLQLSIDPSLRQRFKREGYAANAVQHPGVVRVLDDDVTEDGAAFLVMELVEGETAADRAERLGGRLPIQDVMPIIDGVLDILDAAHAGGIVHRDIKPENIFFTRDRQVKLFDFGIARLRDGGSAGHTVSAMGTPAFMPPEQALGHMDKVDALSDVWATGATMYTLLSGRLVHECETMNQVLIAAATRPASSLALVAPDVPPEIVEVVDRALAYEKKKRWSTAKAMQHALRNAVASSSSSWGRISLVAAEASGSHPRVLAAPLDLPPESIPERRTRDALARPSELGSTGADMGVTLREEAAQGRGRAMLAMSAWAGAVCVMALAASVFVVHRYGAIPLDERPTPPSATTDLSGAQLAAPPPPEPAVSAAPQEIELANDPASSAKAPSKPAPHLRKPPPSPPDREKTWLDRRR